MVSGWGVPELYRQLAGGRGRSSSLTLLYREMVFNSHESYFSTLTRDGFPLSYNELKNTYTIYTDPFLFFRVKKLKVQHTFMVQYSLFLIQTPKKEVKMKILKGPVFTRYYM